MVHFLSYEVRQLLHNKFVVVLGDSIQRAVYKDLVLLLQRDTLLTEAQLKAKGELSFEQDRLVAGGQLGELHNGTHYREVRQFLSSSGHHLLRFYFLTRVYSAYVEDILTELESGPPPDLVIMNSCLWDLSRYGRNSIRSYQENLECLFERMEQVLPASCLLVWTLAMPLGDRVTGGFLLPELRKKSGSLRVDILEANFYCSMLAGGHHFDVLDLHFHFRHAVRHRRLDGIHWDQHAHRHLSQLLLAHVAEAWGVEAPTRGTPFGEWNEEQRLLEHRGQRRHPPQRRKRAISFEPVTQEMDRPRAWLDRQFQPPFLPSPQSLPFRLPLHSPQALPQESCFFSDNPVLPGYLPLNYIAFNDPLPPPAALDYAPARWPLYPSVPHYGQRHNLVMHRVRRHVPSGPYSRSREEGLSRQWSRSSHRR
ncbi:PC-esterase domain-containing protein 1A [Sminthopsis crassicaudata]|uniref:PC-esterase domain-containing protein 1A n=1 Tax=Sminthopsis crassicaudata TaxID=9301 RepID=UPI003D697B20